MAPVRISPSALLRSTVLLIALAAIGGLAASAHAASALEVDFRVESDALRSASGEEGLRLMLRGGQMLRETGEFELPFRSLHYVLPPDTRLVGVTVEDARWEELTLDQALTKAGQVQSSEGMAVPQTLFDEAQKIEAKSYPPRVAVVGSNSALHGYRVGSVNVYCVQALDETHVRILRSARLQLELEAAVDETVRPEVDWPGLRERDAAELRALVANDEDLEAYAPAPGRTPTLVMEKTPGVPEGRIEYLIVTTPELAGEFQRLADRKEQEGLSAAVVTVDWIQANYRMGADMQETVRFFLRSAYAVWGTRYLLLGGDADVLAPRYCRSTFYPPLDSYTDIPTDLYFACLDGTWNEDRDGIYGEGYQDFLDVGDNADLLAELAIGRAPVSNVAQTQLFIDKILEYQNPTDPSYVGRALFASEVLFPPLWNQGDPITLDGANYSEDIIFNKMIAGGNLMQSWRLYENYTAYFGSEPLTKQATLDSLQTGRFGLFQHMGHGFYYNMSVGDANIFVANLDLLSNAPNYFVVYALDCSSGAFDFECILEHFVLDPDGGSVASIGSVRAAFPTTADEYEQAFYEEIFVLGNTRIGDALKSSRSRFVGSTFVDGSDRWTHFTYTLLGDPALRMWREEPTTPTVTHVASLELGDASLDVTVESAGTPVVGVDVGLRRPDGELVHAVTGAGGLATVPLGELTAVEDVLHLLVSGEDLLPYEADIPVGAGGGGHVFATAEFVDDDGIAPSVGDADGLADAGETVEWAFRFTNNGGGNAGSVVATLSLVDAPGVTVLDDTIDVGSVASGGEEVPADVFLLQLDPAIADGSLLRFGVTISSISGSWNQELDLQVLAPEIEVLRLTWDDSTVGNGDGAIQPGEEVDLFFELKNYGQGIANQVTGTLASLSPDLTVVDDTNDWSGLTLKVGDTGAGAFRVVESNVGTENWMLLTLTDEMGRITTHRCELRPPVPPSNVSPNTSIGPTSIALLMESDFQVHFAGYRVYGADSEAGPFVELTEDPLIQTGFFVDDGLERLTRYYYRASVVDSSGVESPLTAVVDASTAPPELAGGFPIELGREVAGCVAVGDLRGDGTLVAGFGSDFLYALDSDGQEMMDGDQDSQTLGPLGGPPAPDNRFTPSGTSMADLDGDGAVELLGSNWVNYQVWALKADGTNAPGWPTQMNSKAWATPVIGDLDGNGDLEVIVNNVVGYTYVWNHDGSDFFDGDNNASTIGVFHRRPGESFGRGTPALFDVDGDDTLEIIFGTNYRDGLTENHLHALKNDGTDAPGWPRALGVGGAGVSSVTVADLDRDGVEELIYACDNDSLYVLEPDGSDFPGYPRYLWNDAVMFDSLTPTPGVGDFDKDGDLELVVVSVVSKHLCHIQIWDHDGTLRDGWPRSLPGLSECSPVVADINGDFQLDVLFGIGGGSDNDPNALYAFEADGSDVAGFPITMGGAVKGTPTVTDFDQDGDVDVVYVGFDRFLHVWDMPAEYHEWMAPWATFHGNMRRTGLFMEDRVVGIEQPSVPGADIRHLVLHPNMPNPFNPVTTIRFEIPAHAGSLVPTRVEIYDLAGRRVRTLLAEPLSPGPHERVWTGIDDRGYRVSSGVYVARVQAAGEVSTVKMSLVK